MTRLSLPLLLVGLVLGGALTVGCSRVRATERARSVDPGAFVGLWGADSAIGTRSYERVTSMEDWTGLWLRHVGKAPDQHSAFYNAAGVPDVDFERCMVVAVLQGRKVNSAGVRLVSVTDEGDHVRFRFDDRSYQTSGPAPGGGARQATPYGFFVLPRSTKEVVLEEDVQGLIGRDPVWKERARMAALAR